MKDAGLLVYYANLLKVPRECDDLRFYFLIIVVPTYVATYKKAEDNDFCS